MSTIDPRFDPRFQRGFTGEGSASADATAAHLRAPAAAPAGAVAPPRSRIADPPTQPRQFREFAESAHFARESTADHELSELLRTLDEDDEADGDEDAVYEAHVGQGVADGSDDEEYQLRPRRNPWLVALWVASVALIVVPAGVFWQVQSQQFGMGWSGDQPPDGYLLSQLVAMLAPTSVIVGSLGVLAALCVHAVTWSGHEHNKPHEQNKLHERNNQQMDAAS